VGKLSINTVVYSKAFISKIWADRAHFAEYERRGFFQFLYITACGHAESIIADYMKAVLHGSCFAIKVMPEGGFPERELVIDGVSSLVSTEYEQRAVQRVLERTMADIDRASFDKLESLHRTIVGCALRDIVGGELHDHLKGLLSIRNLLAHGRELYIDITREDNSFVADVGFEQHPLENAIKSLRRVGLFADDQARQLQPADVKSVIYEDDVVIHFWNASATVAELYSAKHEREKLSPMFDSSFYALPKLESESVSR